MMVSNSSLGGAGAGVEVVVSVLLLVAGFR
jgi:hypothetical protein